VLLPGDHEDTTWQAAVDWAKSLNGELPTRREQSLLFANGKQHFEPDWYWSGELHASDASYAWYQYFSYGDQLNTRVNFQCRARSVRRLPI
jgi:lysozyme family protein